MGFVISTESRHCELATVYRLEHDSDVIEYFDQPEAVKLIYPSRSGRMTGAMHTPDFLVLRRDSVAWLEIKPEDRLLYLAGSQPHRYRCDQAGKWQCPPGDVAAKEYGFAYTVVSSKEINRVLVRNLEFLDDYFRDSRPKISSEVKRSLLDLIQERPGISVASVRGQLGTEVMDVLFGLVAAGEIYFNMEDQAISEQESAQLYSCKEVVEALQITGMAGSGISTAIAPLVNGQGINEVPDPKMAFLQAGANPKLETTDSIADSNLILGDSKPSPEAIRLFQAASPKDVTTAIERRKLLIDPKLVKDRGVPERTMRRWRHRFRTGAEMYGQGYFGLLPRCNRAGNPKPRLAPQIYDIAQQVISEIFMTPKRVTKIFAFGHFLNRCQTAGLPAPSYVWFANLIHKLRAHEVKLAREGKRAAYSSEFSKQPLSAKNNNHGDYPWEVVHIDHTEVDVELVDEETGIVLGRPWLTLMFDAYSRRILCFILSFDAPSINTLKLLLRECVRHHSRLPSSLVLDWGKEFGSEFFETLTALYEVRIIKRPPHQSRHGSVIEREFGSLNKSFFHNMSGNTQNMKNVRQVTQAVNPKNSAVWSLESLNERLVRFCIEVHDQRSHSGIGTTPAEAYARGMATTGSRPSRHVEFDDTFKFLTLATTPKQTARIQPGMGVKIRYFHYWCEEMRDPQWELKQVPVRYDPQDAGIAYVRLGGRWIQCRSYHYDAISGRTDKQLTLAVQTLRQKRSAIERGRTITASQIARFFESGDGEEALRSQRMKDQARRRIAEMSNEAPAVAAVTPIEGALTSRLLIAGKPVETNSTGTVSPAALLFENF